MHALHDRHAELQRLERRMDAPEGSLVVVWGRRRVGKTRILVEWARQSGCYTVADQSAASIQRRYLAEAVSHRLPGFGAADYPDWQSLLWRLSTDAKANQWRGPIVFDELPYLVITSPELPSVLQRWVDHECKPNGLVLAVAGSSQRMMQGLVLDSSAPLYGRASELLHLGPLPAGYLREAFHSLSPTRAVEYYTVLGGVPYYWELALDAGEDLDSIVDTIALDPLGPLHREPDRLLLEESPPALSLRPILDCVGLGAHRISEIAARLGVPASSLSRQMANLQDMELLQRHIPFGENPKSSKRSLYRIADPFHRLWFRVVAAHRAELATTPRATRLALWSRYREALVAQTWEDLCRAAVPYLSRTDTLPGGPWGAAQRYWQGNNPEWDCVAQSIDRAQVLLGECKWSSTQHSAADLRHMESAVRAKPVPPVAAAKGPVRRALFVPAVPRAYRRCSDMTLVTAQDVMTALTY